MDAGQAGDVAPDGSPVALYLALSGDEEAAIIHAAIPPGAPVLELGCGAGRVTRHLVRLGHPVTGVDNSPAMLAHLGAAGATQQVLADITTLDLTPRQWPVVLAASHLVNDDLGPAFLAAAARHVAAGGCVLIQRHPPGWIDTVAPSGHQRHGVKVSIGDISRAGPGTVRATMVYEVEGQRFEQPFTAHEVDDERLSEMAAAAGLTVEAVLDDRRTWIRLSRARSCDAPQTRR